MLTPDSEAREGVPEPVNPLGLEGIEFVEYRTRQPQMLGRALEAMGFRPVARHRSREVLLFRQGPLNVVVDAHDHGDEAAPGPFLSAVAFRVADAAHAHRRCVELGAWPVASHAQPMELNIPAIRGPGWARFFFVDRWREFSIFDIDFTRIPTVDPSPPALVELNWFGIVQYVAWGRAVEWSAFFGELFGMQELPPEQRFGILPKGTLLRSPGGFCWQLVEPDIDAPFGPADDALHRVGLATPDVPAAVAALRARGVQFVETETLAPNERGALTRAPAGGVPFELVRAVDER